MPTARATALFGLGLLVLLQGALLWQVFELRRAVTDIEFSAAHYGCGTADEPCVARLQR
jgi:hypothetical protein